MPQSYPVSAIAALLKLSERRVQQLVKEDVLPRPIKGVYEPIGCVHGYIEYLKRLIAGGGELSLTDERTRLTKFQADLAELQYKKANGELIDSKLASSVWGEIVAAIRQKLLGLPTRLAPILSTSQSIPEFRDVLEKAVYEVLNELTNPDLESLARVESSSENLEGLPPPTSIERKRVGRQKKATKPGVELGTGDVANK